VSEIWGDVIGYEGLYQVSDRGRVKRVAGGQGAQAGRVLKPQLNTVTGYLHVGLSQDGKVSRKYVHRLVLEAHVGSAPSPKHEGNHKSGDRANNRVENLEWVTRAENERHAFRELGHEGAKGEANGSAILTRDDVIEIRELWATGEYLQRELAEMFGISEGAIGHIVRRETWKEVL